MEYQYGQNGGNNNYQGNNDYIYYEPYGNGPINEPNKKKEKKGGAGIIISCLVLSLLMGTIGGAGGTALVMQYYKPETATKVSVNQAVEKTVPQTTESASVAPAVTVASGLSIEQISKMCLPSVVAITNKSESEIRSMWGTFMQESESSGSGVIIGKTEAELLIVTNYHVVTGNKELSVLFSYQEGNKDVSDTQIVKAGLKDYNSSKDLAVISVPLSTLSEDALNNIKVASLGDSNELSLGEQVVAIGNALGYGQSVTTGIVSALGRSVAAGDSADTIGNANEYIQTDAAINPGNSGGALFNMKGELVGINSAKMMDTSVEGMGYAIPITDIKDDMESMMQHASKALVAESERGYLGISGSNVTDEINQVYDIPVGAHISGITAGSPAEKAGLQRGMVITKIDGKAVRTIEELKEYLAYYKAGETVKLTVQVRTDAGYQEKEIPVTLYTAQEAGITQQTQQSQEQSQSNGYQSPYESEIPYNENPFGDLFPFFNR